MTLPVRRHSRRVAVARVTAIVPTLADRARNSSLLRALDSLRTASREPVQIVVVVNGNRFDPHTIKTIAGMDDVLLEHVERASLPYAIEVGRSLVMTQFFCFLDDDDEYLPGAIDQRLNVLSRAPFAAMVATNGYRRTGDVEIPALVAMSGASSDPLRALFNGNWLASCGGLYRTRDIGCEYFRDINPYTEWTWIAFRLALSGMKIIFLDQPTFRINDTVVSESKSEAYRRAFFGLYRRMLAHDLPRGVRRVLKARISDALHDLSAIERARGNHLAAWRLHVASIASLHGLRYLPYTRHLAKMVKGQS